MTAHRDSGKLIPGRWVKASRSNGGTNCVEVRLEPGGYRVRDTKQAGEGPELRLTRAGWESLRDALLTAPEESGWLSAADGVQLRLDADGLTMRQVGPDGHVDHLSFTPVEHLCFVDGLRRGEFEPAC